MMVSESPMMKPLRTGSEMNAARNPSRRSPATVVATPTHSARATVSGTKASELPPATSPTVAADSAAAAAIGAATRCLELPSAA
jgi:hypothetical protein